MLIVPLPEPLPIGRLTPSGRIVGFGVRDGERYYWLADDETNAVALMPWSVVEPAIDNLN